MESLLGPSNVLVTGGAGFIGSAFVRFLVERDETDSIIAESEDRVKNTWYEAARSEGVSEQDCDLIVRPALF